VKLISHRGNIDGPYPEWENTPEYVLKALETYDVAVDVWYIDGFYLGSDYPSSFVTPDFIRTPGLWCHAKTIIALKALLTYDVHCFFHQNDDCTLTSKGYIWTCSGKQLTCQSVAVLPELQDVSLCYGVCSDYISRYLVSPTSPSTPRLPGIHVEPGFGGQLAD